MWEPGNESNECSISTPDCHIGNQHTLMNTTANVNLHTMWLWWCHQKLLEFADVGGCGQGETGCIATTNGRLPHLFVVGHHGHLYTWSRQSSLQYTPHKTTPSYISFCLLFLLHLFSLTKQHSQSYLGGSMRKCWSSNLLHARDLRGTSDSVHPQISLQLKLTSAYLGQMLEIWRRFAPRSPYARQHCITYWMLRDYYHTSNSRECMGVNGEALQLYICSL